MNKFTSIALAFLLVLSVLPAVAADQTGSDREPVISQAVETAPVPFQALSKLSATERKDLVPLTDKELASVEGEGFVIAGCFFARCANIASIHQSNSVHHGSAVLQANEASINQNIGFQKF
jgi:hypothetical protein